MKESTPNPIPEDINFHEVARERAGLRKIKRETPEAFQDQIEIALEEAHEKAKLFKAERGKDKTKAKERLKADKEKAESSLWLDRTKIDKEIPEFPEIDALSTKLEDTVNFKMTLLHRKKNDPYAKTLDSILTTVGKEKSSLEEAFEEKKRENPLAVRAHKLVSYKEDLHKEGHIAKTPSVEKQLEEIAVRLLTGKPIFLHGPTGTGKTSLALYAAKYFTGRSAETVSCNPQTKVGNILSRRSIVLEKGQPITVDIYGPLARAMSQGKVIIFDEFNSLESDQMDFLKLAMLKKIGDEFDIEGNGRVTLKPGFQIIFTANLRSPKHPEKKPIPQQMARQFEQNNLKINYTSKEESYDIILSRLMNQDGSVDMSIHDLDVTLPKLCEAMAEIQMGYTDELSQDTAIQTGTLDASGKKQSLEALVMTQGSIEDILERWLVEKSRVKGKLSFTEFIDKRLQTTLTFDYYPLKDRVLAAKILASKGFLRTLSEKELGLPAKTLDFDKAGRTDAKGLEELRAKSGKEVRNTLTEISKLDPFETRGKKIKDVASGLLGEDANDKEKEVPESPESIDTPLTQFLLDTYKGWGVKQDKLDTIKWKDIISHPASTDYSAKMNETDPTKYGEFLVNPDTININWDSIAKNQIKVIELPASMNGKKLSEVAEYIKSEYGDEYKIPGLEYYKYICENPDKAPDSLKDGNYHFFFGSLFRDSAGYWNVLCARGGSSGFGRDGRWLGGGWSGDDRVVLLEN